MGLLGVVSLLSYAAAVFFSPLAYPGYNAMAQAVSDLSAVNAPSQMLWNQLSALYNVCGVVSFKVSDLSFNNLIVIALAKNNVKLAKKEALEYLATEGYIVQRRNSDIEEILADASQLREIDNNNKITLVSLKIV